MTLKWFKSLRDLSGGEVEISGVIQQAGSDSFQRLKSRKFYPGIGKINKTPGFALTPTPMWEANNQCLLDPENAIDKSNDHPTLVKNISSGYQATRSFYGEWVKDVTETSN